VCQEEHWIPPVLAESEAKEKLRNRCWRRWWRATVRLAQRLRGGRHDQVGRTSLRLVSLPAVVIEVQVEPARHSTRPAHLLLHGFTEQVEVWRFQASRSVPIPDVIRRFPYPLGDEESLSIARQALSRLRLGRLLSVRLGADLILKLQRVLHYPYWVLYEQRDHGRVDFRIVDAVNGCSGGVLLRKALVRALNHERGTTSDQPCIAALR
jgi:hypothetical protein